MDRNRLIGSGGDLPWHLPADLKHFKAITMGKPVLMGRRTHESIGRPLPGRQNLVVSRDREYRPEGVQVFSRTDLALNEVDHAEEVLCIGGAALYQELLPCADRLYLTEIDHAFEGNVWFPAYDPEAFTEVDREEHAPDEKNPYPYRFRILERI